MMLRYNLGSKGFNLSYNSFIEEETSLNYPLIFLTIRNQNYTDEEVDYQELRNNEADFVYSPENNELINDFAVYNLKKKT